MDGILFALSLEVALLQMKILEGCSYLRSEHLKLTNKIQRLQREKLLKDRETVKETLRKTLIEVTESGECRALHTATECFNRRELSIFNKRLDQERFKLSLEKIVEELYMKRKKWEAEIQNADNKIPVLQDKLNDDTLNVNARLRYAEKWLLARSESLELEYNAQFYPLPRIDHEQRVHKKLLKFYDLQMKEQEQALQFWQMRYSTDINKMNDKLRLKRQQLKITTNRRIELQKTYDLHEGEMRGWLTFKQERAARWAREEHQRASAARIQAWWRGIMVRRAIGAFRHLRNTNKPAIKPKKKYLPFFISHHL